MVLVMGRLLFHRHNRQKAHANVREKSLLAQGKSYIDGPDKITLLLMTSLLCHGGIQNSSWQLFPNSERSNQLAHLFLFCDTDFFQKFKFPVQQYSCHLSEPKKVEIVPQSLKGMPVNSAFLYDCAQGTLWVKHISMSTQYIEIIFFLTLF